MKVYHHGRNQTFNLSELESAINLIRDQYGMSYHIVRTLCIGLRSANLQAHDDTQEDPDLTEEDDLCPVFREHRRSCYVCRVWSDGHSLPKADGKFTIA
jgi:hypothetical protein